MVAAKRENAYYYRMIEKKTNETTEEELQQEVKNANNCMLIGAGVGAAGIVGAIGAGAVCPICVVAAPGLIGFGLLRRLFIKFRRQKKRYDGG